MAAATIKLVPMDQMINFYTSKTPEDTARKLLSEDAYFTLKTVDIPSKSGEDVAEELFDLSNNPGREDERQEVYGNHRSISVGDVITVDGVNYLCASIGWKVL